MTSRFRSSQRRRRGSAAAVVGPRAGACRGTGPTVGDRPRSSWLETCRDYRRRSAPGTHRRCPPASIGARSAINVLQDRGVRSPRGLLVARVKVRDCAHFGNLTTLHRGYGRRSRPSRHRRVRPCRPRGGIGPRVAFARGKPVAFMPVPRDEWIVRVLSSAARLSQRFRIEPQALIAGSNRTHRGGRLGRAPAAHCRTFTFLAQSVKTSA